MIAITGGAGFIGSRIAIRLNQLGYKDLVLVDHLGTSDKWKNLRGIIFEEYLEKKDFFSFLEKTKELQAVIHMGACSSTSEGNASYLMENNYRYTRRLAEWCLEKNVRFIYASSAATYGDGNQGYQDDPIGIDALRPLNIYGYSKQAFDQIAFQKGWFNKITGLKFFNIYGPNESHKGEMCSVVFKAYHQIKETGRVQLFKSHNLEYCDGGQLRDFAYVKDVEKVVAWLLEHDDVNGLFNLGTGRARSFEELANATFRAMGKPVSIEFMDMPKELQGRYQYFTEAKMESLRDVGYRDAFFSLEEGVSDYVKNYLESV